MIRKSSFVLLLVFTLFAMVTRMAAQNNAIQLRTGGSNSTTLVAASSGGSFVLTLPGSSGANGNALITNGNGGLSWGTVSSVTSLDGLTDAKSGGSGFINSLVIGHDSTGSPLSSAENNTAVGVGAMKSIVSGVWNIAIGTNALTKVTSGSRNSILGGSAGYDMTTASNNVIIGQSAGVGLSDGSGNVWIGYNAGPVHSPPALSAGSVSNTLYIDNSQTNTPLIHGNFSTDQLTLNGHVAVAIGITTSTVPFLISGTGAQGAANVENAYLGTDVPTLLVRNSTDNDVTANAAAIIAVGGSGGGDAYLSFDVGMVGGWSIGVDNSDEDKLKVLDGWDFRSDGGTPAAGLPVMTMTRFTKRVGIGTEAPTSTLEVNGDLKAGASTVAYLNVLDQNTAIGEGAEIAMQDGSGGWFIIDAVGAAGGSPTRLRLFPNAGGEGSGMTLTAEGRTGVGTATPAYDLDVVGDIRASGDVRSGATILTSDSRLKRNIQPIGNALAIVSQLRPVSYEKRKDLKSATYPMKQIGFIAQELEQVLPDAVLTEQSPDAIKSVDYISLIGVLTRAMQEQQQRIETLEALVQELRDKK